MNRAHLPRLACSSKQRISHGLPARTILQTSIRKSGYSYSFCSKCGSTVPNIFRTGDGTLTKAGILVETQ